jgi:hypothetical protein
MIYSDAIILQAAGGISLFLEDGSGSANEVCDVVLLEDVSGFGEVLTHVGGPSLFLEFDLDLGVSSADQVLHDDLPGYHTLCPWSNIWEDGHCLLANLPHNTVCSRQNGMPSSYLVVDKCQPWSRSDFSPGSSDCIIHLFPLLCTRAFQNLQDNVSIHHGVRLNPYSGIFTAPSNFFVATQDRREISIPLVVCWPSTALKIHWFSLLVLLQLHVFYYAFRWIQEIEQQEADLSWFFKVTSYRLEYEVSAGTMQVNMQVTETFSLFRRNDNHIGIALRFPKFSMQEST